MSKVKVSRWLNNLITVFLISAIIGAAFIAYGCINNRFYKLLVITSDSMSPIIKAGDLILITPAGEIDVNDIVTFSIEGRIITHRVIETEPEIRTKGDSNNVADDWTVENISGIYRFKIPYIGYPISAMRSFFAGIFDSSGATFTDRENASVNIEAGIW